MASYRYIARDLTGIRKEGFTEAGTSAEVAGWLREQGFTPIAVSEVAEKVKKAKRRFEARRIKSSDLASICWQLTTMVEGGVPITGALETIAEDVGNKSLQAILEQVVEDVAKGETLSHAIGKFPRVFGPMAQALILAGESGGTLVECLRRLAEYFDNRDKLAKKVKGAMAYPCFILFFIIGIVTFIMAFIVPKFREIFDQIGGTLPAFTRGFMAFYDVLRFNLLYIIGGVVAMVIVSIAANNRTRQGHYFFSRIALGLPLLGTIMAQAFVATFCRTMATLIDAGVSVLDVFDILFGMTRNDIIKDAVEVSKNNIVKGTSISAAMETAGFWPRLVTKMIKVGEESGSLGRSLDRTADYYERKVEAAINTLMSLLEPIMVVTVGGIVLVVVIALYLPIFSMSDVQQ